MKLLTDFPDSDAVSETLRFLRVRSYCGGKLWRESSPLLRRFEVRCRYNRSF